MPSDKEIELEKLFKKLDINKDGNICISDLIKCLSSRNLHNKNIHDRILAKLFLKSADVNKDGFVDFAEFVRYIETRDDKLNLAFREIELNMNKAISIDDIKAVFRRLNISITNEEAEKLVGWIDKDGKWKISEDEWREFLFFHPANTLEKIVHYWQHGQVIDVGADWVIPEEFDDEGGGISLQLKRLISGGIAGAISRTITAPLDRVKVLLQVHGYKHINSGIWQSMKYMRTEGGLWSFWRGNGINVIKIVPETALKFTTYEYFKSKIRENSDSDNSNLPLFHKFLAASMAGVTATTIIYPLETLKVRLCLRKTGQYHSAIHCTKMIYKEAGFRSFYRGFFVNIIGIIPYAGIEMTLYEKSKSLYMTWADLPDSDHPHPLVVPLLSSFSATCGIFTTYPLALIRTKLQSKSEFTERNINSAYGLLTTIYRSVGFRGLYRGVVANLCKVLPASSISYLTYEQLNRTFDLKSFGAV